MKIGIGITTYNRPECLAKCLEQIQKHTFDIKSYWSVITGLHHVINPKNKEYEITWYTATDTDKDRRGVAYRKNECLRALQHCDHIFLFDDDCYPIKDGWVDFFINSGQEHLLYLNKNDHQFKFGNEFQQCGGVFMYIRKSAVERVGAFNEKFGIYGFEHAEYSNRIYGKRNYYLSLPATDQYIYAEDYNAMNFKSSISEIEKQKWVKANWDKYFNEPLTTYIPL